MLDFSYNFSVGTANNDNVSRITNNTNTGRSLTYSYDELNRIKSAVTDATSGQFCWAQLFGEMVSGNFVSGYDIWGNLKKITPDPSRPGCAVNTLDLAINTANRIMNTGYAYDAAGNMTADPATSSTYHYDAENRIDSVSGTLGAVAYRYDGDGKRLWKAPSGTPNLPNKLYWYGMGNDPLDETDSFGTPSADYIFFNGKRTARLDLPSAVVHYYFSDHLGSANVVTSNTGTIQDESDYYPFGGERIITNSDPNQYKFTGKERDSESGLDNFTARYFGSSLGRFMSPDPLAGHTEDPQTLNRYAYVRNNPLNLTDPTGLDFYLSCQKASATCQKDAAGNLVQGTTTTDENGKLTFNPTVVTSASLQDPNSGNTGTVNENGVQITTTDANGNKSTAEGIFINNTPAADLSGSGKLQDFSFHIDSSDEKKGTLDAGTFSFNANRDQTRDTLDSRGAFRSIMDRRFLFGRSPDELKNHGDSTQHRFGTGPSPHFSVPDNPKNTVPTVGPFHVDRDAPGLKHLGCATLGVGCK